MSGPSIIYCDTETIRFRPGLMAPPIVCVQWCVDDGPAQLMTRAGDMTDGHAFKLRAGNPAFPEAGPADALSAWARWALESGALLVLQNGGYDLACFAAHDPSLVPLIFRAFRENRITDTMWRQKLADIGEGKYRGFFRGPVWIPIEYNLGDVANRYGYRVDKNDPWRLHYDLLIDVPLADWPAFRATVPDERKGALPGAMVELHGADAIKYALGDPLATRAAYLGQCERYGERPGAQEPDYERAPLLCDQFAQGRKYWALHLTSVWGLRTSLRGVLSLEQGARAKLEELEAFLKNPAGHENTRDHAAVCAACRATPPLVKPDGVRDTKAATARMIKVCAEAGISPRMTKGSKPGTKNPKPPAPSLDSDACKSTGDPLLEAYAELSSMKKVLSNDVKALQGGIIHPIHTHFDIAETGRTTSAGPNVQNPRRLAGVRECYVPRGYQG